MFIAPVFIFLLLCCTYGVKVCPYSEGGYHVLLETSITADPSSARPLCRAHGWEYAVIPANTWQAASNTLNNCTDQSAGIWSFDGLLFAEGPCQFLQGSSSFGVSLTGDGVFALGLPSEQCKKKMPVLCREKGPVGNKPCNQPHRKPTPYRSHTGHIQRGSVRHQECGESQDGIHMLTDPVLFKDAAKACLAMGWKLADLNKDTLYTSLASIWTGCQPPYVLAWINSYEGVDKGDCRFLYSQLTHKPKQSVYPLWAMLSMDSGNCQDSYGLAICMDSAMSNTVTAHSLATSK